MKRRREYYEPPNLSWQEYVGIALATIPLVLLLYACGSLIARILEWS